MYQANKDAPEQYGRDRNNKQHNQDADLTIQDSTDTGERDGEGHGDRHTDDRARARI